MPRSPSEAVAVDYQAEASRTAFSGLPDRIQQPTVIAGVSFLVIFNGNSRDSIARPSG